MNELVDWLRAQLDEDERVARECIDEVGAHRAGELYDDGSGTAENDAFPSYPWGSCERELAYMAGPGHPARVLREVAAKRAIVDEHEHRPASPYVKMYPDRGEQPFGCRLCADNDGLIWPAGWCRTLRLLASVYDDRPGYREEWRP